jgi:hypothetical protein
MKAVDILTKAADLIHARAIQRDKPDGEKSMARTVAAFNAIYGTDLSEVQGWHFMELLKMVRSAAGIYIADDYEDKVSYAALAAEAASPSITGGTVQIQGENKASGSYKGLFTWPQFPEKPPRTSCVDCIYFRRSDNGCTAPDEKCVDPTQRL